MNTEDNLDLPWYVNNTLDAARQQQIKNQLSQDATLQQEADFLQHIRQQIKNSGDATPGEFGWQKLQRQIKQSSVSANNRRWQVFAVAASLLLVLQTGVIFNLIQPKDSYAPLSGISHTQPTLQIRFNASISEADMRQALLAIHGQIINGPSANGIYRVSLENTQQRTTAMEQLRASGLVDHVATE